MKKSILENHKVIREEINKVAEVAGYLWQKGWAERNGGNITINITEHIDEEIKNLPAISDKISFGTKLEHLEGTYFYCKGTNKRMRDLARFPMENGSIIRICNDCETYEIIADKKVIPTSEIVSHLCMHNYFIKTKSKKKAVVHTHPIDLVAMSHYKPFLEKDVLSHLLWSMIPETKAFCPKGLGIAHYAMPSSQELAEKTIEQLDDYDVVLWEKHGVCSTSEDVMEAFDMIDTLSKSAQIYLTARSMGFTPDGMSQESMDEMTKAFNLPK